MKTTTRAALAGTALLALALLAGHATPAHAQAAPCRFQTGFADLAARLGARAGACLEDEHPTERGDAEQRTTAGVMVWRRADNRTVFTDGARTWVLGPEGLAERGNTERFPWEIDAGWPGTTLVGAPPPAAESAPPAAHDLGVPGASAALQVTALGVERVPSRLAPAGKELLRVRVRLDPGTRGVGSYDYLDFRVRSREGYEFRVWAGTPTLPHGLDRGTLRAGQWVEGDLEFEVAADASGFTLIHDYQGQNARTGVVTRRLDALA